MIIRLDSFSKQILNILVYFVFQPTAMLKFVNSQHYPRAPFARFIGSLMSL